MFAQPALGARCIVFVDDAFADHRVDLRHCFLVEAGSLLSIPIRCCFLDFLDGRTHARPQCHIVLPAAFCLPGPLGCRFDICQLLVLLRIGSSVTGL